MTKRFPSVVTGIGQPSPGHAAPTASWKTQHTPLQ